MKIRMRDIYYEEIVFVLHLGISLLIRTATIAMNNANMIK
jgi:hypothetical protein